MDISLLSCPVCLKPHFDGVDSLRSSLISVATTQLSCPVCNELLLGLDKLTIHLFSHITSNKAANNNENALYLTDSSTLQENVTSPEKSNENRDNSTELFMHEEQNTNLSKSDLNFVRCDICNYCFADENVLNLHQKLLHETQPDKKTGKYNYHCHLCCKQFKMRGSLMVHMRVAHYGYIQSAHKSNREILNSLDSPTAPETPPDIRQLDKCSKTTGGSPKGQDNKQWECEVCLKLFTTKYFLKKHKRLHTGEMPYYCSQCNKYFTFQQSYHKHMLYHSDDKPHSCIECGRAFKELSTLHNHQRIHSGERPFTCESCGKCFRQRVSYLVHRRIHTGVMPYKCTACNKSFRYKVSQRSHKCPSAIPGVVVKTLELESIGNSNNIQNIVSSEKVGEQTTYENPFVDQSEPKNFFDFLPESITSESYGSNEQSINFNSHSNETENTQNQEYFNIILTPVLSDVQSLCLSSYPDKSCSIERQRDDFDLSNGSILETINEESFKELLYGSTTK